LTVFHGDEPGVTYDYIAGKSADHTVKGDVTNAIDGNKTEDVTGDYKHISANTDIESEQPIGVQGTETQLGADVLQVFFDDIIKAVTRNPVIIPPAPLPPGAPVPPVPPLINMHLKGVWDDIAAAANKAKASCAKALK
jgi:hypothetical protein